MDLDELVFHPWVVQGPATGLVILDEALAEADTFL
jgi:hypothetical protein